MTPFARFLSSHCDDNVSQCERTLGLNRRTVMAYRDGRDVPEYVLLACAAVAAGLPPYGSPAETPNDVKEQAPD